jgi:hypothetical protein
VRAAQGISLPQASALQRHQRRSDYGGEHSAGSLEAVSFAISPASTHVCAPISRLSLLPSTQQDAPSSALRYACLHGLSVATAHVCHCCRTRPLLLTVPFSHWPSAAVYTILLFLSCGLVPHVIAAQFLVLNECTTLHRTNVPGQVKVNRKTFFVSTASLALAFLSPRVYFSPIPCPPALSHGVSHRCPASVCTPRRRWLPPDSQRSRRRRRSAASTRKIVSQLVVAGPTSTVDHGAFPTGPPKRRTTAPGVPPTVPYGPSAEQ